MRLLEIRNLGLEFGRRGGAVQALQDVSLSVSSGETVCLVGESGSGKSITGLSIARLIPTPPARYIAGQILLEGKDTLRMPEKEIRKIRGATVSYVFQDPGAALNPVMSIGSQIKEVLALHRPRDATRAEIIRLLELVGIPAPASRMDACSHELSGGMQQRAMIAMAIASRPKLLVADEPTTALDVTVQAQIVELLRDLQRELGMAILLITHNLGLVGDIADQVAVMYAGQIVETAPTRQLIQRPLHPYTRALINSVPRLGAENKRLTTIPGVVPRLGAWPSGCRFHPRCTQARPVCRELCPSLDNTESAPARFVRCPYWAEGNNSLAELREPHVDEPNGA